MDELSFSPYFRSCDRQVVECRPVNERIRIMFHNTCNYSQLIFFCLLVLLLPTYGVSFNPDNCNDGVTETFQSNGFKINVASSAVVSLLKETSQDIGGLTYREAIDDALKRARAMLRNISSSDAPYEKTMKSVPFRIEEKAEGSHFFYSGRGCSTGCVVTEQASTLIRDIYNDPTLFLHEYAHVYQLAVPSSAESIACDGAFKKWKADIFPQLDKSEHPFNDEDYGGYYW